MVDSGGAECATVVVWELSHLTIETFFLSSRRSGNTRARINLTLTVTTDLCQAFNFHMSRDATCTNRIDLRLPSVGLRFRQTSTD